MNISSESQPTAESMLAKELLDQLIAGSTIQGEFQTINRVLKKAIIEARSTLRWPSMRGGLRLVLGD